MQEGQEQDKETEARAYETPVEHGENCEPERGEALGFKAVLIDIKADWPEMSTGMGFPAHNHTVAP
eukprot:3370576-Pyramimonas_sp.AAC.1